MRRAYSSGAGAKKFIGLSESTRSWDDPEKVRHPPWPDHRLHARAIVLATIFFGGSAVVMTWPLASDLRHSVFDPGLPYFVAWILHWDWFAVHSHRPLFEANIFFPSHLSLLYSENLLGAAIFGFPLFAAGAGPILVENVLLLGGIFLMGFSAWLLAYDITRDGYASLVAGVVYAFAPYRGATLQFFQLQWGGFLPLIFLFLRRFLAERRIRDLLFFAFFFTWNGLTCVYYEFVALWGIGSTFLIEVMPPRRRRWTGAFAQAALALGVSAILLSPVYLAYARVSRTYGFRWALEVVQQRSPDFAAFLSGGVANRLRFVPHSDYPEWQLFPGAIPLLLIIVAALAGRRRSPSETRRVPPKSVSWCLAMIAAGVVVALGPRTPLYTILSRLAPVAFGSIRDTARGYVLALLGIGVLASIALTQPIFLRYRLRRGTSTAVALFALAEFTVAPVHFFAAPTARSPLSSWLTARPDVGAMLELPMKTADNIEYVFRSTEHGRPIMNGYSGFYPAAFVALTRAAGRATDFEELAPFVRDRGVGLIVYHGRRASRDEARRFARILRSGTEERLIAPLRFLKDRREEILVFELGKSGRFPLADAEPATDRVTAQNTAERFFADPSLFPQSAEATVFAWPDFF